jgi:8-oxo-dGTP pyrophosphatase MutT (NUDIX family)
MEADSRDSVLVRDEPSWALASAGHFAHSRAMSAGDRLPFGGSHSGGCFRRPYLRKPKACEQVAAVCYRIRDGGAEFLLVRTRGGRWTFPKGSLESGLTHAEVAALEAFEEAGVHGRMEATSFARYTRRKHPGNGHGTAGKAVYAHLCEVTRLEPPQEANRNPTWFLPAKAKERLQQGRAADCGAEFARVVDRAVARIQRLRNTTWPPADALNKVQLEAFAGLHNHLEQASFASYIRRGRTAVVPAATIELVQQAKPYIAGVRIPQLTNGSADAAPAKSEAARFKSGRDS